MSFTAASTINVKNASHVRAETAGTAVWDRIWRNRPTDARDDALLERERRSVRWALIVKWIEETFGGIRGLRTIELGCGRGDLSALLARQGARVTLLDASTMALSQAAHRFDRLGLSARCEQADMLGPLRSLRGSYDVALSSGVIEHFKGCDRTRAVRAHFNVLRQNGLAVISVPNARCIPYRLWKAYLELRGRWPYGMEIPYGRRELLRLARRVGFATDELACYGFWQSVGSQFCKTLFRWAPDWYQRQSVLDPSFGLVLVLFARRHDTATPRPRESVQGCGRVEANGR